MPSQDDREDPSAAPAEGAPRPASAAEPQPPRAPFAPPVTDPNVLALLNGLSPSVTPPPVQVAGSSGDLAAKFTSPPRSVPGTLPGVGGPGADEAKVIIDPDAAPAKPMPRVRARARAADAETVDGPDRRERGEIDTTFRIRGSNASWAVPLTVLVVVSGIVVAVWLGRSGVEPAPRVTSPVASPSVVVPVLPDPRAVAVPTLTSSVVTPPAPPAPPASALPAEPPVPVPSIRTTPATSPTKPAKPPRRKEDEPERVL